MIITPETTGNIPEKEQKALENVKQEILLGEQKVAQLNNAQRQLKSEIQADLTTKAQIAEVITKLTVENDSLATRNKTLTDEQDRLLAEVKQAKEDLTNFNVEKATVTSEISSMHAQIDVEKSQLESERAFTRQGKQDLEEDKRDFAEKVKRINEAIK